MPTVTLLREHVAALDGVHARTLSPGDRVDVTDELAHAWAERGIATSAAHPAAPPRRRGRAHTPKRETT